MIQEVHAELLPLSDLYKYYTILHFKLQDFFIAPPIIPCQKDESRKEIYQGRKMQECYRISSFSDAEKFSLGHL